MPAAYLSCCCTELYITLSTGDKPRPCRCSNIIYCLLVDSTGQIGTADRALALQCTGHGLGSYMKSLMRGAREQWDLGSCHARRQRRAQQPRRASARLDHLPQIEGQKFCHA